ncbi:hypothetical protein VP01_134g3 [Puccinia sorghi]|uniref:Uncharacterized protein n=1 Tax=Puccinia sorghi TaxID=27349 RepID=A0A0L6VM73_9BASI|nr:hypothetical protein VP01_134g3 [Puccinia sorghi]
MLILNSTGTDLNPTNTMTTVQTTEEFTVNLLLTTIYSPHRPLYSRILPKESPAWLLLPLVLNKPSAPQPKRCLPLVLNEQGSQKLHYVMLWVPLPLTDSVTKTPDKTSGDKTSGKSVLSRLASMEQLLSQLIASQPDAKTITASGISAQVSHCLRSSTFLSRTENSGVNTLAPKSESPHLTHPKTSQATRFQLPPGCRLVVRTLQPPTSLDPGVPSTAVTGSTSESTSQLSNCLMPCAQTEPSLLPNLESTAHLFMLPPQPQAVYPLPSPPEMLLHYPLAKLYITKLQIPLLDAAVPHFRADVELPHSIASASTSSIASVSTSSIASASTSMLPLPPAACCLAIVTTSHPILHGFQPLGPNTSRPLCPLKPCVVEPSASHKKGTLFFDANQKQHCEFNLSHISLQNTFHLVFTLNLLCIGLIKANETCPYWIPMPFSSIVPNSARFPIKTLATKPCFSANLFEWWTSPKANHPLIPMMFPRILPCSASPRSQLLLMVQKPLIIQNYQVQNHQFLQSLIRISSHMTYPLTLIPKPQHSSQHGVDEESNLLWVAQCSSVLHVLPKLSSASNDSTAHINSWVNLPPKYVTRAQLKKTQTQPIAKPSLCSSPTNQTDKDVKKQLISNPQNEGANLATKTFPRPKHALRIGLPLLDSTLITDATIQPLEEYLTIQLLQLIQH